MLADAARIKDDHDQDKTEADNDVHRELKTKEEIENYINSLM